jgi:putative Mg2+ transporter-C (MgtC) family protein
MDIEWLALPDGGYLARVTWRLVSAAVLGGLVGAEREWVGKAAGLRTHMTVALGAAAFILIALEVMPSNPNLSPVIQGIAAGIGFIGAGTILKRSSAESIQGLTTAATIWLTAAIGTAAGAGHGWLAAVCVVTAWVILTIMTTVERWVARRGNDTRAAS